MLVNRVILVHLILIGAFLQTIFNMVFAGGSRLDIKESDNDFECAVVKQDDAYQFVFKEIYFADELYIVNKGNSPSGVLEYGWVVHLGNDASDIDFGLYYFKRPNKQESLSLKEILIESQVAFFTEKGEIRYANRDMSSHITFDTKDYDLVLTLDIQDAASFRIGSYDFADFWIFIYGKPPKKCRTDLPIEIK